MDLDQMTPDQLAELIDQARALMLSRQNAALLTDDLDEVIQKHRRAGTLPVPESGQPWDKDAIYGLDDVVTHKDRIWKSVVAPNSWEPGVSGWRAQRKDGKPAAYVQPSGAHDAYRRGESVTEDGVAFVSLIDGNVWPPSAYPAGWVRAEDTDDTTVDPQPGEDPAPEADPDDDGEADPPADGPPATPAPAAWAPGMSVAAGDLITYEDVTYRVLQPHVSQSDWLPPALPSLYQRVES